VESEGDLNFTPNGLDTTLTKFNLKINIKKIKVLIASKSDKHNTAKINIGDESIYQEKGFRYLGSIITEDSR